MRFSYLFLVSTFLTVSNVSGSKVPSQLPTTSPSAPTTLTPTLAPTPPTTLSPTIAPTLAPTSSPTNPPALIQFNFPQYQCTLGTYTDSVASITIPVTNVCPNRHGFNNACGGVSLLNNGNGAVSSAIGSVFASVTTSMTFFFWMTPTSALVNPGTVINIGIFSISITTLQNQLSSNSANYDVLIQLQNNVILILIPALYSHTSAGLYATSGTPFSNAVAAFTTPGATNTSWAMVCIFLFSLL